MNTRGNYSRDCPICGKPQHYSFNTGLYRAIKENRWCKSCKMASKEVRRKIGEKSKGRLFSAESRKKMSDAHIGRIYKTGYKLSNETRKKLSEIHKTRKRNPHSEETKYKLRLAHINYFISRSDYLLFMLDNNNRISQITKLFQNIY